MLDTLIITVVNLLNRLRDLRQFGHHLRLNPIRDLSEKRLRHKQHLITVRRHWLVEVVIFVYLLLHNIAKQLLASLPDDIASIRLNW